jgi:hypothetical protein
MSISVTEILQVINDLLTVDNHSTHIEIGYMFNYLTQKLNIPPDNDALLLQKNPMEIWSAFGDFCKEVQDEQQGLKFPDVRKGLKYSILGEVVAARLADYNADSSRLENNGCNHAVEQLKKRLTEMNNQFK